MNTGQPYPAYPSPVTPAPAKKGLSTGAIIAIVIGSLIALCCVAGTVVALAGGGDTDPPSAVAATDDPPSPADPSESAAAAPPPSPAADGPVTVKVGQAVNVSSGGAQTKVTIKSVKKAKSTNMFDEAERGQFVAVDVDIFATKGETDLGPSNFRLIAKDGTVYKYEIMIAGIKPQLDAMTTVQEGQRKTGKVVFDIDPEKFAGLKVELLDDFGDVQSYWTT